MHRCQQRTLERVTARYEQPAPGCAGRRPVASRHGVSGPPGPDRAHSPANATGGPRLDPKPLWKPPVDPLQAGAFGRPGGVDGSFGARRTAAPVLLGAPPVPEFLEDAFGRPGGGGQSLGRPPAVDSPDEQPEPPGDPWRDPNAGARLGPPALPAPSPDVAEPVPAQRFTLRQALFDRRLRPSAIIGVLVAALVIGGDGRRHRRVRREPVAGGGARPRLPTGDGRARRHPGAGVGRRHRGPRAAVRGLPGDPHRRRRRDRVRRRDRRIRLHPDQQSRDLHGRDRPVGRADGDLQRRPAEPGAGHHRRPRPADRPGRAEGRRQQRDRRPAGRLRGARGRRPGHRDRLAAGPGRHRDHRHRVREGPAGAAAGRRIGHRRRDRRGADRRRGQSRELRWSVGGRRPARWSASTPRSGRSAATPAGRSASASPSRSRWPRTSPSRSSGPARCSIRPWGSTPGRPPTA